MALEFDSAAHIYRLDGRVVPSVTQVLSPLENFERVPWDVLEAARVFGQHVHEAMALLVRDELDWGSLDPSLVPYILGGKRFLDESGITVIASEQRVSCKKLRVAGTLDLVGHWRNTEVLVDFKATAAMPRSVGAQTAAYDRLYTSQYGGKPRKRYGVQLKLNDYRVTPLTESTDWHTFVSCLNIWNYKNAAA